MLARTRSNRAGISCILMGAAAAMLAMPAHGQVLAQPDTVVVQSGLLRLRGLVWRPPGNGPFPAVLFNHGSGTGFNPRNPAILGPVFARHGYVFLFLYRRGSGLSADQGPNSAELMNRARAARGQSGRNEAQLQLLDTELSDVLAGLTFLRSRPDVDSRRMAVVGHSFGGQLALLLSERDVHLPTVVFGAAAASWDASPELQARLIAAVARTGAPIFLIHAANDFSVAPAKALAEEMTRRGKPNRIRIYPAIGQTTADGHAFLYSGLSTWELDVFAFLDEHARR